MERQIVLDERSFKALSADSRVSILKSLGERRRTLTELGQKLNLGNSTVKEHCDILINAELIRLIDEGRKWKYYELTQKGRQIVTPNLLEEAKVLIILCMGVFMIGAIAFFAMQMTSGIGASYSGAPEMRINTILAQNETPLLAKTAADINRLNETTVPATDATANDSNTENPDASTPLQHAPQECTTTAQCSINGIGGITPEFFILSTMVSIVFGIVLGWAIIRRH